ncbi:MAG: FIVAR domain-containing protein, partial [Propionibacteriaceae bacterium]|jgi:hypothetical protein|nr:FIVAR domain-containing protein [Propionibacteriaceae bacterium]
VTVYEAAVKAGTKTVPVDKSVLESGIDAAGSVSVGVVESVDGSDVDPTGSWVTAAVQDALDAAVAAAEAVLADSSATQGQVDAAVEALADAVTAYEAAIKAGTKTVPVPVVKDVLASGVDAAKEAVSGVVSSVDGSDVPVAGSWVTAEQRKAFDAALAAAEAVLADPGATQAEVDAAVAALAEAVEALESQVKPGTQTISGGPTLDPPPNQPTQDDPPAGGLKVPSGGQVTESETPVATLVALLVLVLGGLAVGFGRRSSNRKV